jgi:hypothetical protein
MMTSSIPPPPVGPRAVKKAVHGGPVPRLDTLWKIEAILREANEREEDPITFEEIKRRLGTKSVRHSTIRACVTELERQGMVSVAPSGVAWTYASDALVAWESTRKWTRLA